MNLTEFKKTFGSNVAVNHFTNGNRSDESKWLVVGSSHAPDGRIEVDVVYDSDDYQMENENEREY